MVAATPEISAVWRCPEPWQETNHCHSSHFDIKLGTISAVGYILGKTIPEILAVWHVIMGNTTREANCFTSKGASLNEISHAQCESNIRVSLFPGLYHCPVFDRIQYCKRSRTGAMQGRPENKANVSGRYIK